MFQSIAKQLCDVLLISRIDSSLSLIETTSASVTIGAQSYSMTMFTVLDITSDRLYLLFLSMQSASVSAIVIFHTASSGSSALSGAAGNWRNDL